VRAPVLDGEALIVKVGVSDLEIVCERSSVKVVVSVLDSECVALAETLTVADCEPSSEAENELDDVAVSSSDCDPVADADSVTKFVVEKVSVIVDVRVGVGSFDSVKVCSADTDKVTETEEVTL
jgi:hypothetical protein